MPHRALYCITPVLRLSDLSIETVRLGDQEHRINDGQYDIWMAAYLHRTSPVVDILVEQKEVRARVADEQKL